MSVWSATPVDEVPELVLSSWAIMEVSDGETVTRHFAGYNETEGEGRASSAIVTFDAATMKGVTSSGRVYQLRGDPGLRGDGLYVWGRWERINGVTESRDVSQEVLGGDA